MTEEVQQTPADTMDAETTAPEIKEIQTFVFFDLETNGVAGMDTKITELSMVAVSRNELLDMKNNPSPDSSKKTDETQDAQKTSPVPMLPRVLHKYTRLYYPRKLIHQNVEQFTGLSNELLHRLPGFSSASADAISLFLDLPKPVALVAHNGARFDFPLLKAELGNVVNNVCESKAFQELLCVDSLLAIRAIDAALKEECEVKEILAITSLAASFSVNDMDDESMDLEPHCKKLRSREGEVGECSRRAHTPPSSGDEENVNGLEISAELPVTPAKEQISMTGFSTPQTPVKAKIPPKEPVTPETSVSQGPKVNGTSNVRRNLMYGSKKRKWDGTQPFKQVNIYERLFGSQYYAHRAEADCTALLEICGHYADNFVSWADANACKFAEVKPMWVKRKSFQVN